MQSPRIQSAYHKAAYLFSPVFAVEVREHAERHEKLLRRLGDAVVGEDGASVKSIQKLILRSYSSKLSCLVRSAKNAHELTPDWVTATAKTLDPWKDCGEKIVAWAEPKASGDGWRPVCSFGPKRKALQTLVADILTAKFGSECFDYLVKGKGAEAASDEIVNLIDCGYRFFVLADIKDFFRSAQKGYVDEATGLPKAVVRNSVLISPEAPLSLHRDVPYYSTIEAFDGAVQSGLPQGSRTSQIIASLLLGPVLRKISPAKRIVVHGDDSAIGVRNEEEAHALTDALAGVLKSHPAGPFRLKRSEVVHANDGFDFLQYHHRYDVRDQAVHRRPSANSYRKYGDRVRMLVLCHGYIGATRLIARYRFQWMKSFRRWQWNNVSKLLLWFTTKEAMKVGKNEKA